MRVKGLDGKEHSLILVDRPKGSCSKNHEKARDLLKSIYPFDTIFEEITLSGSKTPKNGLLYADFFIPKRKLIVEVQGEQHEQFNSFFYSNKLDFVKAKTRDKAKKEWCQINNFKLVELPHNESTDEWIKRIEG